MIVTSNGTKRTDGSRILKKGSQNSDLGGDVGEPLVALKNHIAFFPFV
jgi:hypothetical protein